MTLRTYQLTISDQIDSSLEYCIECLEKGHHIREWWPNTTIHNVYFTEHNWTIWGNANSCDGVIISFMPYSLNLDGSSIKCYEDSTLLFDLEVNSYSSSEEGFFSLSTLYDIPFTYEQFSMIASIVDVLSKRT